MFNFYEMLLSGVLYVLTPLNSKALFLSAKKTVAGFIEKEMTYAKQKF